MPTAKLIPSEYHITSSYLTVDDEENAYTDISSTTYATITNTSVSTSYYYFYLRGFNFSAIPARAEVTGFTVKIRGRASGAYNAALYLAHGTTTISGATASALPNSSSATTRTLATGSLTWADIVGYGDSFGIRINGRRNAKNTVAKWYVYGAEIDVTYNDPPPEVLYFKDGGSWVDAKKAYKRVNGLWVEQSDPTAVFDPQVNYVKG